MLRLAKIFVRDHAAAEEVVQDAWVQVLRAIDAFEGRSSLRTWIFVILGNCARKRAERESRYVSFTAQLETSVESENFFPGDHPRWAGMWTTLVDSWASVPDDVLMSTQARERIAEAIQALPANHAAVLTLRDIEGWESSDVCALLGITAENQRVLLHRARNRLRAALREYFERDPT